MSLSQVIGYIALLAASLASDGSERDWILITTDEDLNVHLVDRSSVAASTNDIKSAWLRYDYYKPPAHQPNLNAIEALENFDCLERRRQITLIFAFLKDGKRVTETQKHPWRAVTAGSSSELEFEYVCSGALAPPR